MEVGRWELGKHPQISLMAQIELLAHPSPLRFDAAISPFSKAFVRLEKLATESAVTVLIFPGNSAMPARKFPAQFEVPLARRLWTLGFGLWTPAREMRAMFLSRLARRIF